MKTYSMFFLCLMMLLGLNSLSSAAIVIDPAGDTIAGGPTDILAVQAQQLMRVDGYALLKLSLTATPNIGGIVIFEADVDGSIGTGNGLIMQFVPDVFPCPCKTVAGIDVAITMINRMQGPNSSSAMCEGCVETTSTATSCGKRRWPGEWYAAATSLPHSLPHDSTGVIRGFSDPQPIYTTTSKCYTFPWDAILVYVRTAITDPENQYNYSKALDPATTRWQVSVWTDPNYSADEDDFANGTTLLNISDLVPNVGLIEWVDYASSTPLTFCEGNFDGDLDVDGSDAAKFKSDFGRSSICASDFGSSACTVCPRCGPYY